MSEALMAGVLMTPWLAGIGLCVRKAWRKAAERRDRDRRAIVAYRRAEYPFN